jgi:hypothetical protein
MFYRTHSNDLPCDGSAESDVVKSYYDLFLQIPPKGRSFFVVDGIDPCTDDGLHVLFDAWGYISSRSSCVLKLYVSSRNHDNIRERVETSSSGANHQDVASLISTGSWNTVKILKRTSSMKWNLSPSDGVFGKPADTVKSFRVS